MDSETDINEYANSNAGLHVALYPENLTIAD